MAKNRWEYPGLFEDLSAVLQSCPMPQRQYHNGSMGCAYCECIFELQWAFQAYQKSQGELMEAMEKQMFIDNERKKVGYVTRRCCPFGYVAVTKPLARKLYEMGVEVTLCGNNVNSFHVFGGWHLGCTIQQGERYTDCYDKPYDFQYMVGNYVSYNLGNELGRYAVFYVRCEDLPGKEKV